MKRLIIKSGNLIWDDEWKAGGYLLFNNEFSCPGCNNDCCGNWLNIEGKSWYCCLNCASEYGNKLITKDQIFERTGLRL